MSGAPGGSDPKRSTLSRELSEFLIELSIALHKHAMYPSDHPSLPPAASGVVRRATQLLLNRTSISLGVARSQLVIEGVATDSRHPVLSDLARRLHKHHLGAVTFYKGLAADEVVDLLRTLAVDAEGEGQQPLGLGPAEKLKVWQHARLHALAYDRLELLDDDGAAVQEAEEADAQTEGNRRVRGAQLWVGLARAALAGQFSEDDPGPMQPSVVAKAIDEHPSSGAYDQVIVGYLLQIAEELRATGGEGAVELRRRTSLLLKALRPQTLQRLVEMGGDATQRNRFVRDAADGLAVDAVVDILTAAAEASQQQISHSLVRLLSKLASHAEHGALRGRPVADQGLRDQVRRLLSDWELKDPNPGVYGAALERISKANPLFLTPGVAQYAPEDERLVQVGLECGAFGARVRAATERLLAAGKYTALVDSMERAGASNALETIRAQVLTPEVLTTVLSAERLDLALLDRLIALAGPAVAAEPLLDELTKAESRSVRRLLINRLVALGSAIVPAAIKRLDDERWYVVRNALALIDEMPELPFGFSAAHYTRHADPRVRRQALKMQIAVPDEREQGLKTALDDSDPEIVRLGLHGLEKDIPMSLVGRIEELALDTNHSTETRELAIRALGYSHTPSSAEVLLSLADGGRNFLGRVRLAPKTTEMLAALRALAIGWNTHPLAALLLKRAVASADPVVRAAVAPAKES